MTQPAVPDPDDKDWTWTLERVCPECGFDASALPRSEVPGRIRAYATTVREAVQRAGADLRPAETVWSPLEYGAHVRDVCILFGQRLTLMLTEHDPVFANWDQDTTALEQRYWTQEPVMVAEQLAESAEHIAVAFEGVEGEQWDRPGRRSNGSAFTVDSFARYLLHDLAHHAWDVTPR